MKWGCTSGKSRTGRPLYDNTHHDNKVKSSRIVSHTAAIVGDTQPDTAYRQIVVRMISNQSINITQPEPVESSTPEPEDAALQPPPGMWVPAEAKQRQTKQKMQEQVQENLSRSIEPFAENGKVRKVVEYIVLQKMTISGVEDAHWKVWGFTQPSTPRIVEEDKKYWREMLDHQVTAGT